MTGGFKLLVLVAYLVAIRACREIRRVFQYHGAEHKTIYAYEEGLPLTVANVRASRRCTRAAARRSSSSSIIVSIVVGSVATPLLLPNAKGLSGQLLTLGLRIGLLPLIAAVSLRAAALQRALLHARACCALLLWPGFLFQKITTREPDDTQLEIAIAAMRAAMWREERGRGGAERRGAARLRELRAFIDAVPALRPVVAQAA